MQIADQKAKLDREIAVELDRQQIATRIGNMAYVNAMSAKIGMLEAWRKSLDELEPTLEECDIQAIHLAIAELSLRRPGWNDWLSRIATKFGRLSMYQQFRTTSGGIIKEEVNALDGEIWPSNTRCEDGDCTVYCGKC